MTFSHNTPNTQQSKVEDTQPDNYLNMLKDCLNLPTQKATEEQKQFAKACEAAALILQNPTWFLQELNSHPEMQKLRQLSTENISIDSLKQLILWMNDHSQIVEDIHKNYEENTQDFQKNILSGKRIAVLKTFIATCAPLATQPQELPRLFNNGLINLDKYCANATLEQQVNDLQKKFTAIKTAADIEENLKEATQELLKGLLQEIQALYSNFNDFNNIFTNIQFDSSNSDFENQTFKATNLMQMPLAHLKQKFSRNDSYYAVFFEQVFACAQDFLQNLQPKEIDVPYPYDQLAVKIENYCFADNAFNPESDDNIPYKLQEKIIQQLDGRAGAQAGFTDRRTRDFNNIEAREKYIHSLTQDIRLLIKVSSPQKFMRGLISESPFNSNANPERDALIQALLLSFRNEFADMAEFLIQCLSRDQAYSERFLHALDTNKKLEAYAYIPGYIDELVALLPDFKTKGSMQIILQSKLPVIEKLQMLSLIAETALTNENSKFGSRTPRTVKNFYQGLIKFSLASEDSVSENFKNFRKIMHTNDLKLKDLEIEARLQRRILRNSSKNAQTFEKQFSRWVAFSQLSKSPVTVRDLAFINKKLTLSEMVRCFNKISAATIVHTTSQANDVKQPPVHNPSTQAHEKEPKKNLSNALIIALYDTAIHQGYFEEEKSDDVNSKKIKKSSENHDENISIENEPANSENIQKEKNALDSPLANSTKQSLDLDGKVKEKAEKAEKAKYIILLDTLEQTLKQFSGLYMSSFFGQHHLPDGIKKIITQIKRTRAAIYDPNSEATVNTITVNTINEFIQNIKNIAREKTTDSFSQWAGHGGRRTHETQQAYQAINDIFSNDQCQPLEKLQALTKKVYEIHQAYEKKISHASNSIPKNIQLKM